MRDDSAVLGELAEEFTAKVRAGELPQIEEYAARHPDLAERIRALFPTLMLLEGMAGASPPAGLAAFEAGATFGAYKIVREIGRGGMGVVYEVVHQALNRRVALKVLPIAGPVGSHLERFLREARLAAGLHHSNIVPVFDVGQVAGVPYYAMQFIDGTGLDRVRSSDDPDRTLEFDPAGENSPGREQAVLPPVASQDHYTFVARVGIQAAEALAYAHRRGIVHRDIKPSNLLIDAGGVVWITDFGLARGSDDVTLTHSGMLVGTPRYMSPEQAEAARRPVDHRTDIYSLGATLYELLTRRPAFTGRTPQEVVAAIIERHPVPPRRLDPKVPRDLETIVLKAMAKRPDDRYASAAEFADDLKRYLNVQPIHARRIGPIGQFTRWCRRNPKLAAVSLTSLSIIVALLVLYFRESYRQVNEILRVLDREQDALRQSRENEVIARQRLVRQYVANGQRFVDNGEPLGGLPWFVAALEQETDPERAEIHRRRIGMILRESPALVQQWQTAGLFHEAIFHPDGRWIAAGGIAADKKTVEVQVWDSISGEPVGSPLRLTASPDGEVSKSVPILAFSSDGSRLATTDNRTVCVWELPVGRRLAEWSLADPVGPIQITTLRFSPDGSHLLVSGDRKLQGDESIAEARVVEAATLQPVTPPLRLSKGPGLHSRAAFSRDGKRVMLAATSGEVLEWDARNGQQLRSLSTGSTTDVLEFSRDGSCLLASASPETLAVWDMVTWKCIGQPIERPNRPVEAHFNAGAHCVLLTFLNGAQMVEYQMGTVVWEKQVSEYLASASLSDGGMIVAHVSSDGALQVSDVVSDMPITAVIRGLAGRLRFSPDGRFLLQMDYHFIRLWDLAPGSTRALLDWTGWDIRSRFGHTLEEPEAQQWSPSGVHVAAAYRGGVVQTWETMSGQRLGTIAFDGTSPALEMDSGSGRMILQSMVATADGGTAPLVRWLDLAGQEIARWNGRRGARIEATHAASGRICTTQYDQVHHTTRITIWDLASNQAVWEQKQPGRHRAVTFSPTGRALVTIEEGSQIVIRSSATGAALCPPAPVLPQADGVHEWSFSADGNRLVLIPSPFPLFDGGLAFLFDLAAGTAPRQLPVQQLQLVALSPDGRRVATVDTEDWVRIWDFDSGRPLTPMVREPAGLAGIAFSPDGRLLVAWSNWSESRNGRAFVAWGNWSESRVRLWDGQTGESICPPFGDGVLHAIVDPNGEWLITQRTLHPFLDSEAIDIIDLRPDDRPVEELRRLAELLSDHRIDETGGYVPLSRAERARRWQRPSQRHEAALWHAQQAARAEAGSHWAMALLHVNALIAAHPDRWQPIARRGRIQFLLRQPQQALADFQRAIALGSPSRYLYLGCGEALAEMGRFAEAAEQFARANRGGACPEAREREALACLAAGNHAGYQRLRLQLLEEIAKNDRTFFLTGGIAWALALPSQQDGQQLTNLARHLEEDADPDEPEPWRLLVLVSLRRSDLTQAATAMATMNKVGRASDPLHHLLNALVLHRQGQHDEARRQLEQATRTLDGLSVDSWDQRLRLNMLRAEAEAALRD